jgi:hypothetical protein
VQGVLSCLVLASVMNGVGKAVRQDFVMGDGCVSGGVWIWMDLVGRDGEGTGRDGSDGQVGRGEASGVCLGWSR